MTTVLDTRSITDDAAESSAGATIEAHRVSRTLRNGAHILSAVTLRVEPDELVAVIGASGAGKTTLLETLAGLRLPSSGRVHVDGWDLRHHRHSLREVIGYVPQDDIIHRDLPVRSTVRHAARLRLPHLERRELDDLVDRTIAQLGLAERAATAVGRLSGGQRKRVSIAVELLTRPRAFFLDEPTSGLDPASARSLLASLRALAADGSTVMLTTHSPDDVAQCDRVVILARGGRLLFHGTPTDALAHFAVDDVADIYRVLTEQGEQHEPFDDASLLEDMPSSLSRHEPATPPSMRLRAQWAVLCRRNVEVLIRNRLTLAIMLGAPALVIAMFVTLYRPDAYQPATGDPLAAVAITYWLAFAAFFFGLTYGLLQVCSEIAVVRRERNVGLGLGAYLLAKVAVLVPVLIAVNVTMVIALRFTNRLPDLGTATMAALIALVGPRRRRGSGGRPPRIGRRRRSVARHARPSDAVLPGRALRWRRALPTAQSSPGNTATRSRAASPRTQSSWPPSPRCFSALRSACSTAGPRSADITTSGARGQPRRGSRCGRQQSPGRGPW